MNWLAPLLFPTGEQNLLTPRQTQIMQHKHFKFVFNFQSAGPDEWKPAGDRRLTDACPRRERADGVIRARRTRRRGKDDLR